MRRRNRIVKIINVSITITAILLVLLIIFLVKNKKYDINIKNATSIKSDINIIDCTYYDKVLEVLNKGKYKKTDKIYGGLHKTINIIADNTYYEFKVYEDKNIITYKDGDELYFSNDVNYIKEVVEVITRYDYSLVKLDAVKIDYYNKKYDFDSTYTVDLKGKNTLVININKSVTNVKFYQIFNDESEILISDAKDLVKDDKIVYYIDKNDNFKIEVIDEYKTNIYKGYIDNNKLKFIELTKEPEIVLNPTDLELLIDDVVEVSVENFNGLVDWYSEDEKVVTVTDGKIKAVGLGKTRVYVITQNKEYYYMNVSVDKPKSVVVEELKLSDKSIDLGMYVTYQLKAEVLPENATNKKLQWSSSNPKVAMVDEYGLVTGLSSGNAIISVRSSNGLIKNCEVKVTIIELKSIKLNHTNYDLKLGEKLDLDVTFSPTNASIKDVKWSTSDVFVATVDSAGNVEAKGVGKVNITVTTKNGLSSTCTINVTE